MIIVIVVSAGLLTDSKEHEPMLNVEGSASYGLIQLANGAVQHTISPLSGDNAKLAEDIIMNCMIKSTIWPGIDIKTLEECYLLRAAYPDGTTSHYYAYLHDGEAVMQRGTDGFNSRIDDDLYEKLVRLVNSTTTTVKSIDGPINTNENIDRTDLDACVSDAILTANTNRYKKGDFAAEAHTVLKTVEKGNKTIVYAMALYEEFNYAGDGLFETAGGHIMASACRDILGEEDIELLADTGQDWYNAFKESAVSLRKENGDDYMRENMPGSWLLLQMLDG